MEGLREVSHGTCVTEKLQTALHGIVSFKRYEDRSVIPLGYDKWFLCEENVVIVLLDSRAEGRDGCYLHNTKFCTNVRTKYRNSKSLCFFSLSLPLRMRIGNIDLGERPVTLAPMEDVTDASFRILCREAGAAMVTTEFVSSDGLVRDVQKTIAKMHTLEEEAPVAVQIYGSIPEAMVDAARMAARAKELADGHGADIVDINFGCPVSKIAGRGAGSGMMREPDKMVAITEAIVKAVDKPVTVKTRLGWDEGSKIIVELAERLQDVGISALTIHGRTRCQMYKGEADWTLIGEVKKNPRMHIPIIGNGDINSAQKAKEAFDRWGAEAPEVVGEYGI